MLYSYNDIFEKLGNDYQILKAIKNEEIFKLASGVYSDDKNVSELQVIAFKYSNAIFTMDSAFYYLGLTDTIPEKYHLATDRDASKISNELVKQYFYPKSKLESGKEKIEYQGSTIYVYNLERMLIELIKNKKTIPFDYYKELIDNYRNRIYSLDVQKIQQYLENYNDADSIMNAIQLEVF